MTNRNLIILFERIPAIVSIIRFRISFLFLFIFIGSLCANSTNSQNKQINIKKKNVSTKEVLSEIERKTEYLFFYDNDINLQNKVSVDFENTKVSTILNQILSNSNIDYAMRGNHIILTKANKPEAKESQSPQQQGKTISGIILDEKGEPIIGASVSLVGGKMATMTDVDGRFKFNNVAVGSVIEVTYIGYTKQTAIINEKNEYHITLVPDVKELEAVIVTALGIKREEKALGYSAQRIGGDAATSVKGAYLATSLTGKISGLKIDTKTDFNSVPTITLRGATPLVVIDGVPTANVSLRELSADDIESYDVLKGGSASALYGSAGANGAIMITTKRGSKEGVTVSVNSNTMFHSGFLSLPKSQTSYSSGSGGSMQDPQSTNLDYVWGDKLDIGRTAKQYNPYTYQYEMMPLVSKGKNNFENFIESSLITNNNVNVAYKGQKGSFRSSLTHIYQKAPFPNNKMNSFTFAISGNAKLSEKLSIDASLNYNKRYSSQVRGTGYGGNGYIYNLLVWTGADYDVTNYKNYWVEGQEGAQQNWHYRKWYNNPYFLAYEAKNGIFHDRLNGQFSATYNLAPFLKTITRAGYDFYSAHAESITPLSHTGGVAGSFSVEDPRGYMVNADAIALADHKIGNLRIDGLFGGTIRYEEGNSHASGTKGGLSLPGYYSLKAGVEGQTATTSLSKTQTNSIYGKIGFSWKSMAFVEATGRNDWSSRLDEDNQSYFYPSVSGSFIPSELISMPSWFKYWKIRGGWAVAKRVPTFGEINLTYVLNSNVWNQMPGATYPDYLRPKSLKAETQEDWEVGTEVYFLNNRLKLDIAYYEKLNYDAIARASISDASGYGYLYINRGEKTKRKGWEVTLSGSPIDTKDFKWESSMNWTRDRRIYVKLDEYSADNLWTYEGARMDATTVMQWERDTDGNLVHDANGFPVYKTKASQIGYSTPDWYWGFSNSFKYKDFVLSISFDGRVGGLMFDQTDQAMWHSGSHIDSDTYWRFDEVVNGNKSFIGSGVKVVSGAVEYDSYGQVISDTRVFTQNDVKVSYEDYMRRYNPSTASRIAEHQIKDETFFKLREISLGYTLPKKIASKLNIKDVHMSLIGQNVLLWSKNFKYSDPDGDASGLLTPSVRYLGFNLKFSF